MDLEDIFRILALLVMFLSAIIIIITVVQEDGKYIYECITLDGEKITCDSVNESTAGLIGRRDDTSYLIKQYKKVRNENKDE